MALAESTATGILAAQPHGGAFEDQGAEGQGFGESPVNGDRGGVGRRKRLPHHSAAAVYEAAELGVQVERLGEMSCGADDALNYGLVHGGARAEIADFFVANRAQLLHFVVLRASLGGVI